MEEILGGRWGLLFGQGSGMAGGVKSLAQSLDRNLNRRYVTEASDLLTVPDAYGVLVRPFSICRSLPHVQVELGMRDTGHCLRAPTWVLAVMRASGDWEHVAGVNSP